MPFCYLKYLYLARVFLCRYESDSLGEGWIAKLYTEPTGDDPNVLNILAFSLTDSRMLSMSRRSGCAAVTLFDMTANTCGSGMQLGCVMGHLPEAGGMGFPLSLHLWLDAAHEDGELTKYTKSYLGFVRRQGLPPPRVLILDKAVPLHNAALQLNQEALRCDDARAIEQDLISSLAVVFDGCTREETSAGLRLVQSVPSFVSATGDLQPPGTMPAAIADLRLEFPALATVQPLSESATTCAATLFLPAVLREYGPGVIRGVSAAAHSTLSTVLPRLRTAPTIGDWNVAAAQLLWLESFAAVGGPLESFLQKFVLTFVLLCIFHVLQVRVGSAGVDLNNRVSHSCTHTHTHTHTLSPACHVVQALEKAARTRGYLPVALIPRALSQFRLVIDGKLPYDQYKVWLTPYLVSAGLERSDDTFAWFEYLEIHWRSTKWWSLVSSRFRSLLTRLGVDTNNTLEGTWETIKNKWGASAFRTVSALLKSLVGLPGDSRSQDVCWLAKRQALFTNILRGRQRVGGGYKRDRTLLRLRRLIELVKSSPEMYVRDVAGVDPHLGEVWVGIDTAGWRFNAPPGQGVDGALRLPRSVRLYSRYDLKSGFGFKSVKEVRRISSTFCDAMNISCLFCICFLCSVALMMVGSCRMEHIMLQVLRRL